VRQLVLARGVGLVEHGLELAAQGVHALVVPAGELFETVTPGDGYGDGAPGLGRGQLIELPQQVGRQFWVSDRIMDKDRHGALARREPRWPGVAGHRRDQPGQRRPGV
jgi:hypothetical protein